MKVESAINLQGTVVSVATSDTFITLTKGEQFQHEMDNTLGVIFSNEPMTIGEYRRKWMHDKLDAWIDEVSNE